MIALSLLLSGGGCTCGDDAVDRPPGHPRPLCEHEWASLLKGTSESVLAPSTTTRTASTFCPLKPPSPTHTALPPPPPVNTSTVKTALQRCSAAGFQPSGAPQSSDFTAVRQRKVQVLKLFIAAAESERGAFLDALFFSPLDFHPIMLRSELIAPAENATEARARLRTLRSVKTVLERHRLDAEALSFRRGLYTSLNAPTRAIAPLRRSPPHEGERRAANKSKPVSTFRILCDGEESSIRPDAAAAQVPVDGGPGEASADRCRYTQPGRKSAEGQEGKSSAGLNEERRKSPLKSCTQRGAAGPYGPPLYTVEKLLLQWDNFIVLELLLVFFF